jgi:5'-nucleotidase/UDP-sugar diphosphatase
MNSRMSRRTFLRSALAVGAGAVLYRYSDGSYRIALANPNAGPEAYKLRIIHTNDHHARIEPVNITIKSSAPTAARDFGGVARRKTMFDQIRAEADGLDKLFLDAGDVFQGTLYFNEYEGQADLFFYNALGYHAMTLGNHEFDKGDKVLADFITGASFPVISANVSATGGDLQPLLVTGDDTANGKLGQRKIVTFGAEKIGIFGLTTPETPLLASPSAFVTFDENLAVVAQAQVDALKLAGCNKIIALTHLGYGVDIELAKATKGIDVIIGGHSHTPVLADSQQSWPLGVTRQGPYPTIEKDMDGNDVVVVTDWEWGKWVGDIVVGFDAAGLVTAVTGTSAVKPVWAGGLGTPPRALLPDEGAEIAPDAAFQAKIDTDYKPGIDALTKEVIGKTDILLDGSAQQRADTRNQPEQPDRRHHAIAHPQGSRCQSKQATSRLHHQWWRYSLRHQGWRHHCWLRFDSAAVRQPARHSRCDGCTIEGRARKRREPGGFCRRPCRTFPAGLWAALSVGSSRHRGQGSQWIDTWCAGQACLEHRDSASGASCQRVTGRRLCSD